MKKNTEDTNGVSIRTDGSVDLNIRLHPTIGYHTTPIGWNCT